jgi:hypothetical protein
MENSKMQNKTLTRILCGVALCGTLGSSGCSFMARGPEQYRDDTRSLLDSRQGQIKSCYDNALAQDQLVGGDVVVTFVVQKKTGDIADVLVAEGGTTAPSSLQECVVTALDGLQLTPEDQRDGIASFTYSFEAKAPAA